MPFPESGVQMDLVPALKTSQELVVEMVGAGKRVLYVGGAVGSLGDALSASGNTVSVFETDEDGATEAGQQLGRVEAGNLESADLVALFGAASFDVVVFDHVLERARKPLEAVRQSKGLLADGGSVLIWVPNVAHGDVRLALLEGNFCYGGPGLPDGRYSRFFTRQSLVDFVRAAGFVVLDLRRTHAPLFSTEIAVAEADFDPTLVERLREDVEATTYQFVARAVPDDQAQVSSAQALRVDELTAELESCRRAMTEVTELRHRLLASRDHAIGAEAEAGRLRAQHNRVMAELTGCRVEVETLRGQVPDMANLREHQYELARMRRLYEDLREAAAPLGSVLAELESTKQRLAAVDAQLADIKGSRTWRIGRLFVAPASWISGRRSGKH